MYSTKPCILYRKKGISVVAPSKWVSNLSLLHCQLAISIWFNSADRHLARRNTPFPIFLHVQKKQDKHLTGALLQVGCWRTAQWCEERNSVSPRVLQADFSKESFSMQFWQHKQKGKGTPRIVWWPSRKSSHEIHTHVLLKCVESFFRGVFWRLLFQDKKLLRVILWSEI